MFVKWGRNYSMPWTCLFECIIIGLYVVFAISIQTTMVPFFQDFGSAIDKYFLEGHEIDDSLIDDTYGESRIYTRSDFLYVFNTTVYRFLNFATSFPCSYTLHESENLSLKITDQAGINHYFTFSHENADESYNIAEDYLDDFTSISLNMEFTIQPNLNSTIAVYKVGVISQFDLYLGTGIILWKTLHERSIVYENVTSMTIFTQLSLTVCVLIIFFCVLACIFEIIGIIRFYFFCKVRAKKERTKVSIVFWDKLDWWEIVTFIMNVSSIISVAIYLDFSKDISDAIPWPNFLVAISCFFHCFVLIRYLQLIPSTLIVVRMLKGGIVDVVQFLVGCVPIFFAFMYVGVSLFGWYSPHYTSPRQASKLMISSSYGDYLLDGYIEMSEGADKSKLIPSIFFTTWIFNSYLIWFYIILSSFHEALVKQVHIAREEKETIENDSDDPLPWLEYLADHQ